jgi:plastocyanin
MDRRTLLATAAGAAVGFAGCSTAAERSDGQTNGQTDEFDVGTTARRFEPDQITVSTGETVVWKNTSSPPHTVTAYEDDIPGGSDFFASGAAGSEDAARDAWNDEFGGALNTGDTYEYTFTVAGEYSYFCIPHEVSGMRGVVVVE